MFNIGGNKYRLISRIRYDFQLFVRTFYNHTPQVPENQRDAVVVRALR